METIEFQGEKFQVKTLGELLTATRPCAGVILDVKDIGKKGIENARILTDRLKSEGIQSITFDANLAEDFEQLKELIKLTPINSSFLAYGCGCCYGDFKIDERVANLGRLFGQRSFAVFKPDQYCKSAKGLIGSATWRADEGAYDKDKLAVFPRTIIDLGQ